MLTVHPGSDVPLVEQVRRGVRRAIAEGELAPGDPLPPVRQLAGDLGVNLNTVARAYRELERDGLVTHRARPRHCRRGATHDHADAQARAAAPGPRPADRRQAQRVRPRGSAAAPDGRGGPENVMLFHVYYPPMMILAPAAFVGLWCWWTGVRGLLPMLLATLGVLAGWGLCAWLWGPSLLITNLFALGGFFGVFFGFGLPLVRRSFQGLPEGPRGAALKPRELKLFRGAFVWPYAAWAALTAWMLLSGGPDRFAWLGPLLGLVSLLVLKPVLRATVLEPEPLGGPDPDGLAAAYARFRRRRTRMMYWLCVILALFATASWGMAWAGAVVGPLVGAFGALFGTWADAQRYLLRRQLSGAAPPR